MANLTAVWTDSIAQHLDAIAEAIRGFEQRIDIGPDRRLEQVSVRICGDGSGEVTVEMSACESTQTAVERLCSVLWPIEKQIIGLNSLEVAQILMRDTVRSQHPEVIRG